MKNDTKPRRIYSTQESPLVGAYYDPATSGDRRTFPVPLFPVAGMCARTSVRGLAAILSGRRCRFGPTAAVQLFALGTVLCAVVIVAKLFQINDTVHVRYQVQDTLLAVSTLRHNPHNLRLQPRVYSNNTTPRSGSGGVTTTTAFPTVALNVTRTFHDVIQRPHATRWCSEEITEAFVKTLPIRRPLDTLLEPSGYQSYNNNRTFFIYILSYIKNFHQRHTIRHTWGDVTQYNFTGRDVRIIFVVGLHRTLDHPEDMMDVIQVSRESCLYDDILLINMKESYLNLTVKNMAAMIWIGEKLPSVKHFYKTDDDAMINVFGWLREAQHMDSSSCTTCFWCHVFYESTVLRDGKWGVPFSEYSGEIYPPFCSGTGYLYSRSTLEAVLHHVPSRPLYRLEDVYFTGLLANRGAVGHRNLGGRYWFTPHSESLTPESSFLLVTEDVLPRHNWESFWRKAVSYQLYHWQDIEKMYALTTSTATPPRINATALVDTLFRPLGDDFRPLGLDDDNTSIRNNSSSKPYNNGDTTTPSLVFTADIYNQSRLFVLKELRKGWKPLQEDLPPPQPRPRFIIISQYDGPQGPQDPRPPPAIQYTDTPPPPKYGSADSANGVDNVAIVRQQIAQMLQQGNQQVGAQDTPRTLGQLEAKSQDPGYGGRRSPAQGEPPSNLNVYGQLSQGVQGAKSLYDTKLTSLQFNKPAPYQYSSKQLMLQSKPPPVQTDINMAQPRLDNNQLPLQNDMKLPVQYDVKPPDYSHVRQPAAESENKQPPGDQVKPVPAQHPQNNTRLKSLDP